MNENECRKVNECRNDRKCRNENKNISENECRNENEYRNEMNTGMKQCSPDGNEGTNQCIIECTKQNAGMKNLCTNTCSSELPKVSK